MKMRKKECKQKNWKRTVLILGCAFLLSNIFVACGEDGKTGVIGEQKKEDGFAFVVNGFSLTPNMDASGIKGALGEPLSYFEEPSCASQGIDKYYTYPGYMIQTYDDGEKEVINYITFKDDSVSTKEGIDLSMTKENVIEAYGEDYYETANSISYESGDTKLKFIFEDDLIIAIEYSVK